jgi:hypothetical protein
MRFYSGWRPCTDATAISRSCGTARQCTNMTCAHNNSCSLVVPGHRLLTTCSLQSADFRLLLLLLLPQTLPHTHCHSQATRGSANFGKIINVASTPFALTD